MLENLKGRIFSRKKSKSEAMIDVHHILMREYGWIPLEELKKTPMETISNLMKRIEEDARNAKKKTRRKK